MFWGFQLNHFSPKLGSTEKTENVFWQTFQVESKLNKKDPTLQQQKGKSQQYFDIKFLNF